MNSSLSRRRLLMLGAQGVTASFVLAACSSTPPDSSDDPVALVNDADMTLSNFLRDPEMTWFRDNLPSARGVLIVPGHYFFPGLDEVWRHRDECLRLNYSQDDAVVEKGIVILADELRRLR